MEHFEEMTTLLMEDEDWELDMEMREIMVPGIEWTLLDL